MGVCKLGWYSIFLAAGALAAAGMVAGCGKGSEAAGASGATTAPSVPAVPVKVKATEARDLQRGVRVVGSLAGLESATLSNRVTGTIIKIYADVGDRVKPCAPLLDIDPVRYSMWVRGSQAALAETLAKLGLTVLPAEDFDIDKTAIVKKALTELENAKSKYDRQKPLHDQGVIKDFEFIDTEAAYNVAKSSLDTAREEARSQVQAARRLDSEIKVREKDLKETAIVAPDGSNPNNVAINDYAITARKVSVGEYLKEGTTLFMLVADGTLKLQARVPERELAKVALGQKVLFRVEAYPKEEFEGAVSRIDPSVDEANRTFMIEALVDNAGKYQRRLRPGSFVQGRILTGVDKDRVMAPLEAIASFVGINKVYVVEGNGDSTIVHSIEVVTGQQEGSWIEVNKAAGETRELKTGDRVVYDGVTKLVDGGAVKIQTEARTTNDK